MTGLHGATAVPTRELRMTASIDGAEIALQTSVVDKWITPDVSAV